MLSGSTGKLSDKSVLSPSTYCPASIGYLADESSRKRRLQMGENSRLPGARKFLMICLPNAYTNLATANDRLQFKGADFIFYTL